MDQLQHCEQHAFYSSSCRQCAGARVRALMDERDRAVLERDERRERRHTPHGEE